MLQVMFPTDSEVQRSQSSARPGSMGWVQGQRERSAGVLMAQEPCQRSDADTLPLC